MRIALTTGYARSLHTIALLHLLTARGHEVPLCLRVGFGWRRLRRYVRQLGWGQFVAKARRRLRATADESAAPDELTAMVRYLEEQNIADRTTTAACQAVGTRECVVRSLNVPAAIDELRRARIDLVVYSGGGILRDEFLLTPPLGVLNAHGGPLPAFRGMNAAEWALLHGVRPSVSVILADAGIDTGAIVLERPVPLEPWRGVASLRGESTRVGVEALADAADLVAAGAHRPRAQVPQEGRQFSVMAPPLLEVLQERLARGRLPRLDAIAFQF
jgi:folate-dependent phosphoribosylglycinamide formyltransferase PurN